jgi:hypothetical protein
VNTHAPGEAHGSGPNSETGDEHDLGAFVKTARRCLLAQIAKVLFSLPRRRDDKFAGAAPGRAT